MTRLRGYDWAGNEKTSNGPDHGHYKRTTNESAGMKQKRAVCSLVSLAATVGLLVGLLASGVAASLPLAEVDSALIKLEATSSITEDESGADFIVSPASRSVADHTAKVCPSVSKIPALIDESFRDIDALLVDRQVFLFFYADWCHYCHEQVPIIDELEQDCSTAAAFVRINAGEDLPLEQAFGVEHYPTMAVISDKSNGQYVFERLEGLATREDLEAAIERGMSQEDTVMAYAASSSVTKTRFEGIVAVAEVEPDGRWHWRVGGLTHIDGQSPCGDPIDVYKEATSDCEGSVGQGVEVGATVEVYGDLPFGGCWVSLCESDSYIMKKSAEPQPPNGFESGCFADVTYDTYPDHHDDMETGCTATAYEDNYEIYQVGANCDDDYLYFMWETYGPVGYPAGEANFSFWAGIDIDDNRFSGDPNGMEYLVDYSMENGVIRTDWTGLHDATSTDWPPTMLYQFTEDDYCSWGTYLEVRVPKSYIQGRGTAPRIWMGVDVNFFSEPPETICMDEVFNFSLPANCVGEVQCSAEISIDSLTEFDVTCSEPGDTVYRTIRFRDSNGRLSNPSAMQIILHLPDGTDNDITSIFTNPSAGIWVHSGTVPSGAASGERTLEVTAVFQDGCVAWAQEDYEIQDECNAGCSIHIEFDSGKTCFKPGETLIRTIEFRDNSGLLADPSRMEIALIVPGVGMPLLVTSDFTRDFPGVYRDADPAPDGPPGTWTLSAFAVFEDGCEARQQDAYQLERHALRTRPDPPSHDFGEVPVGETRQWSFQISKSGSGCTGGTLTWSVSADQPWITNIEPTSGSTQSELDTVTVTVDTTGLEPCHYYQGTITIASNSGIARGIISIHPMADRDSDTVPDDRDNCPDVANSDQTDTDGDGMGNACDDDMDGDGTPNDQDDDRDGDGVDNDQDNCPDHPNPNQDDVNGDEVGDACDCSDVLQGPYEAGTDCGGPCPTCIACTWCGANVTPIRLRGQTNSGLIDIVFVPEHSYSVDAAAFEAEVIDKIRNWYLRLDEMCIDPLPADYKDRFNFYRYAGGFGTTATCSGTLPADFVTDAPFYDTAAILSKVDCGCANSLGPPSKFISTGDEANIVIHESGHAVFGLVDEYCGRTHYEQNDPEPNVWSSLASCQNDATNEGWTTGSCRQIAKTGCTKNFYRYDPDDQEPWAFMTVCSHGCDADYEFGEACTRRINHMFDNWPAGRSRGVLVKFNINQDVITVLDSQVVDGHPDVGLQAESFTAEILSSNGELLEKYGIWDPRIEIGSQGVGSGLVYTDNVDFSLIFPFRENMKVAGISDPESGQSFVAVDLTDTLHDFCRQLDYDDPDCQALDLDNDGVKDSDDNCPLIHNSGQTDADGDGVGDVCDVSPVISNVYVSVEGESATVFWESDRYSDSLVVYGTESEVYNWEEYDASLVKSHAVPLTGLEIGSEYYFVVVSADEGGNPSQSQEYEFTAELPIRYDLSVSSTAGGSVAVPGEGTFTYREGTVVTLQATPNEGYAFQAWTGDTGGIAELTSTSATLTMDSDHSIVANFKRQINWGLIGGIIAAVVAVGVLVVFLRRRKTA